jgi:hypothetical protein
VATGVLALVEVGKTLLEPAVHVFVHLHVLLEWSVIDRLKPIPRVIRGGDTACLLRAVVHRALLSAADAIRRRPMPVR